MQIKSNITKSWRTTLLGLVVMALSFLYLFKIEDPKTTVFYVTLGLGVLLIFSPDSLVKTLTNFINKKKDEI